MTGEKGWIYLERGNRIDSCVWTRTWRKKLELNDQAGRRREERMRKGLWGKTVKPKSYLRVHKEFTQYKLPKMHTYMMVI